MSNFQCAIDASYFTRNLRRSIRNLDNYEQMVQRALNFVSDDFNFKNTWIARERAESAPELYDNLNSEINTYFRQVAEVIGKTISKNDNITDRPVDNIINDLEIYFKSKADEVSARTEMNRNYLLGMTGTTQTKGNFIDKYFKTRPELSLKFKTYFSSLFLDKLISTNDQNDLLGFQTDVDTIIDEIHENALDNEAFDEIFQDTKIDTDEFNDKLDQLLNTPEGAEAYFDWIISRENERGERELDSILRTNLPQIKIEVRDGVPYYSFDMEAGSKARVASGKESHESQGIDQPSAFLNTMLNSTRKITMKNGKFYMVEGTFNEMLNVNHIKKISEIFSVFPDNKEAFIKEFNSLAQNIETREDVSPEIKDILTTLYFKFFANQDIKVEGLEGNFKSINTIKSIKGVPGQSNLNQLLNTLINTLNSIDPFKALIIKDNLVTQYSSSKLNLDTKNTEEVLTGSLTDSTATKLDPKIKNNLRAEVTKANDIAEDKGIKALVDRKLKEEGFTSDKSDYTSRKQEITEDVTKRRNENNLNTAEQAIFKDAFDNSLKENSKDNLKLTVKVNKSAYTFNYNFENLNKAKGFRRSLVLEPNLGSEYNGTTRDITSILSALNMPSEINDGTFLSHLKENLNEMSRESEMTIENLLSNIVYFSFLNNPELHKNVPENLIKGLAEEDTENEFKYSLEKNLSDFLTPIIQTRQQLNLLSAPDNIQSPKGNQLATYVSSNPSHKFELKIEKIRSLGKDSVFYNNPLIRQSHSQDEGYAQEGAYKFLGFQDKNGLSIFGEGKENKDFQHSDQLAYLMVKSFWGESYKSGFQEVMIQPATLADKSKSLLANFEKDGFPVKNGLLDTNLLMEQLIQAEKANADALFNGIFKRWENQIAKWKELGLWSDIENRLEQEFKGLNDKDLRVIKLNKLEKIISVLTEEELNNATEISENIDWFKRPDKTFGFKDSLKYWEQKTSNDTDLKSFFRDTYRQFKKDTSDLSYDFLKDIDEEVLEQVQSRFPKVGNHATALNLIKDAYFYNSLILGNSLWSLAGGSFFQFKGDMDSVQNVDKDKLQSIINETQNSLVYKLGKTLEENNLKNVESFLDNYNGILKNIYTLEEGSRSLEEMSSTASKDYTADQYSILKDLEVRKGDNGHFIQFKSPEGEVIVLTGEDYTSTEAEFIKSEISKNLGSFNTVIKDKLFSEGISKSYTDQIKRNGVFKSGGLYPIKITSNDKGKELSDHTKDIIILDPEKDYTFFDRGQKGRGYYTQEVNDALMEGHPLFFLRLNESLGGEFSNFYHKGGSVKDIKSHVDSETGLYTQQKISTAQGFTDEILDNSEIARIRFKKMNSIPFNGEEGVALDINQDGTEIVFKNMHELWLHMGGRHKHWPAVLEVLARYPEIRESYISKIGYKSGQKSGNRGIYTEEQVNDPNFTLTPVEHSNEGYRVLLKTEKSYDTTGGTVEGGKNNDAALSVQQISAISFEGRSVDKVMPVLDSIGLLSDIGVELIEDEINDYKTYYKENLTKLPKYSELTSEELNKLNSENISEEELETIYSKLELEKEANKKFIVNLLEKSIKIEKDYGSEVDLLSNDAISLDNPTIQRKVASVLYAEYNKQAVKIRIKGGQFVLNSAEDKIDFYEVDGKRLLRSEAVDKLKQKHSDKNDKFSLKQITLEELEGLIERDYYAEVLVNGKLKKAYEAKKEINSLEEAKKEAVIINTFDELNNKENYKRSNLKWVDYTYKNEEGERVSFKDHPAYKEFTEYTRTAGSNFNIETYNQFRSNIQEMFEDESLEWEGADAEILLPPIHQEAYNLREEDNLESMTGGQLNVDENLAKNNLEKFFKERLSEEEVLEKYGLNLLESVVDLFEFTKEQGLSSLDALEGVLEQKATEYREFLDSYTRGNKKYVYKDAIVNVVEQRLKFINDLKKQAYKGLITSNLEKLDSIGGQDLKQRFINSLAAMQANNFLKTLEVTIGRTPGQGKQSFAAAKVKGFVFGNKSTVFGAPEMLIITGADFDIDKGNIFAQSTDEFGEIYDYSKYQDSLGQIDKTKLEDEISKKQTKALDNKLKDASEAQKKAALNKIKKDEIKYFKNAVQNFILDNIRQISLDPKNAIEANTPIHMNVLQNMLANLTNEDIFTEQEADKLINEVSRIEDNDPLLDRSPIGNKVASPYNPAGVTLMEIVNMGGKEGIGLAALGIKLFSALTNSSLADMDSQFLSIVNNFGNRVSKSNKGVNMLNEIQRNVVSEETGEPVVFHENGIDLFNIAKDENNKTIKGVLKSQTHSNTVANTQQFKNKYEQLKRDNNLASLSEPEQDKTWVEEYYKLKETYSFDVTKGIDKNEEQSWEALSELLSAATDNAKELILGKLGIDGINMNFILAYLVTGHKLLDVITLMNTPEAKRIVQRVKNKLSWSKGYSSYTTLGKEVEAIMKEEGFYKANGFKIAYSSKDGGYVYNFDLMDQRINKLNSIISSKSVSDFSDIDRLKEEFDPNPTLIGINNSSEELGVEALKSYNVTDRDRAEVAEKLNIKLTDLQDKIVDTYKRVQQTRGKINFVIDQNYPSNNTKNISVQLRKLAAHFHKMEAYKDKIKFIKFNSSNNALFFESLSGSKGQLDMTYLDLKDTNFFFGNINSKFIKQTLEHSNTISKDIIGNRSIEEALEIFKEMPFSPENRYKNAVREKQEILVNFLTNPARQLFEISKTADDLQATAKLLSIDKELPNDDYSVWAKLFNVKGLEDLTDLLEAVNVNDTQKVMEIIDSKSDMSLNPYYVLYSNKHYLKKMLAAYGVYKKKISVSPKTEKLFRLASGLGVSSDKEFRDVSDVLNKLIVQNYFETYHSEPFYADVKNIVTAEGNVISKDFEFDFSTNEGRDKFLAEFPEIISSLKINPEDIFLKKLTVENESADLVSKQSNKVVALKGLKALDIDAQIALRSSANKLKNQNPDLFKLLNIYNIMQYQASSKMGSFDKVLGADNNISKDFNESIAEFDMKLSEGSSSNKNSKFEILFPRTLLSSKINLSKTGIANNNKVAGLFFSGATQNKKAINQTGVFRAKNTGNIFVKVPMGNIFNSPEGAELRGQFLMVSPLHNKNNSAIDLQSLDEKGLTNLSLEEVGYDYGIEINLNKEGEKGRLLKYDSSTSSSTEPIYFIKDKNNVVKKVRGTEVKALNPELDLPTADNMDVFEDVNLSTKGKALKVTVEQMGEKYANILRLLETKDVKFEKSIDDNISGLTSLVGSNTFLKRDFLDLNSESIPELLGHKFKNLDDKEKLVINKAEDYSKTSDFKIGDLFKPEWLHGDDNYITLLYKNEGKAKLLIEETPALGIDKNGTVFQMKKVEKLEGGTAYKWNSAEASVDVKFQKSPISSASLNLKSKRVSPIVLNKVFSKIFDKLNIDSDILTNEEILLEYGSAFANKSGFVAPDGKVVINSDFATLDTPLHEFGHLYMENLKRTNKAMFDKVIELALESELVSEIAAEYPELDRESLGEEVFVTLLGLEMQGSLEGSTLNNWQKIKNIAKDSDSILSFFRKVLEMVFGKFKSSRINLNSSLKEVMLEVTETALYGKGKVLDDIASSHKEYISEILGTYDAKKLEQKLRDLNLIKEVCI